MDLRAIVIPGLFLVLPLLYFPLIYDQFVLPKTTFLRFSALILAGIALFRLGRGRELLLPIHGVLLFIILYLLWAFLRFPIAASPSLAWDEVTLLASVVFIVWSWQEWGRQDRRRILRVMVCLFVAAGLTALWTLYQDIRMKWGHAMPGWLRGESMVVNKLGDWRGFLTAGFGNSDFISMFLATAYLPMLLAMLMVRKRVKIMALMVVLWLCAAALIVTWSVGNNASLILGFLLMLAILGRKRLGHLWRLRKARILVWLAGCGIVIMWFTLDFPLNPHRSDNIPDNNSELPGIFGEAFGSERWAAGGPTRAIIYMNTLEMIRENQLLGVGPGCFTYVYPTARTEFLPYDPEWLRYQGNYTNAAHNSLLQTWVELGPVGAFLLVAMVAAAFRELRRRFSRKRRAIRGRDPLGEWMGLGGMAALLVLCLSSIMSFPLELPTTLMLFFALLPVGFMLGEKERQREYSLPPVIFEGSWTSATIHMGDMQRPKALGLSLDIPDERRRFLVIAAGILLLGIAIQLVRPVVADWKYYRARRLDAAVMGPLSNTQSAYGRRLALEGASGEARQAYDDFLANSMSYRAQLSHSGSEDYYLSALGWWPRHHDCRSRYSEYLLLTMQHEACLVQMDILMKRLNSSELYLRRGLAYLGADMPGEAQVDFQTFVKRLPILTYHPQVAQQLQTVE